MDRFIYQRFSSKEVNQATTIFLNFFNPILNKRLKTYVYNKTLKNNRLIKQLDLTSAELICVYNNLGSELHLPGEIVIYQDEQPIKLYMMIQGVVNVYLRMFKVTSRDKMLKFKKKSIEKTQQLKINNMSTRFNQILRDENMGHLASFGKSRRMSVVIDSSDSDLSEFEEDQDFDPLLGNKFIHID